MMTGILYSASPELWKLIENVSGNGAAYEDNNNASFSGTNSIARFITLLLIFAFVLFITYLTTKFVGRAEQRSVRSRNLEIKEAVRTADGKVIELLRVGKKYVVVGVGKDSISYICDACAEDLEFSQADESQGGFAEILKRAKLLSGKDPDEADTSGGHDRSDDE